MFMKIIDYINGSLERRIPLAIFAVLMIVLGSSFFLVIQRQALIDHDRKLAEAHEWAFLINQSISHDLSLGDMDEVEKILRAVAESPAINQIRLLDRQQAESINTDGQHPRFADSGLAESVISNSELAVDSQHMQAGALYIYDPLFATQECQSCHSEASGTVMGILVTEFTTEELRAEYLHNQVTLSALAWIIVFIIGGILFFLIRHMVVNPIKLMADSMVDIATGEADLTQRIEMDSEDELGALAESTNMFIENLQTLIGQIIAISQTVERTSDDIAESTEILATGAEEQQAQLSEVATAMEQMSAMIIESSRNVSMTRESTLKADTATQSGSTAVEGTIAGIEDVARIVEQARTEIATLESRSVEIGEVVQVIDEIADQTNLLALNANIEAARAGDAGRGFAVVADEVRKLAERTIKATAEISNQITQIQNDVSVSVSAMETITEKAHENQKLSGQSHAALVQITGSIGTVNEAVEEIANAASEQSIGVETISKNIEGVSTVSKEAANSAQEMATAVTALNGRIHELNSLVARFKI